MQTTVSRMSPIPALPMVLLIAGALFAGPAFAEKPDHAGKGNKGGGKPDVEKHQPAGKSHDKGGHAKGGHGKGGHGKGGKASGGHAKGGGGVEINAFFGDRDRRFIRDYYADQFSGGHCPPGLAKKRNGCMPPGQAKKWRRGHPLPGDVIYHDVPGDVLRHFGDVPAGHKLVRAGADILLIGVGTGLVVDAVEDLGGVF